MKSKLDLIKGGIWGVCVGDALGLPVQFKLRNYFKRAPVSDMIGYGTFNLPPGSWSDNQAAASNINIGPNTNGDGGYLIKPFCKTIPSICTTRLYIPAAKLPILIPFIIKVDAVVFITTLPL